MCIPWDLTNLIGMFRSFRQKILFSFLLIICVSFVIVMLTHFHFQARNRILKSTALIESLHISLLKDENARQNFFNQDTHNSDFFATGNSKNLKNHTLLKDSVIQTVHKAFDCYLSSSQGPPSLLSEFERDFRANSILFDSVVKLILKRGYKNFNMEGAMRERAHHLENSHLVQENEILTLRRHEKDYIIRNEIVYVDKLNAFAEVLKTKYTSKNDSTTLYLSKYQQIFNEIVALDKAIGLKATAGF